MRDKIPARLTKAQQRMTPASAQCLFCSGVDDEGGNRAQSTLLNIRPCAPCCALERAMLLCRSPSLLRAVAQVRSWFHSACCAASPACSSTPRSIEISTVDMPTAHLSRPSTLAPTLSTHARRTRPQQSGRRTSCPSGVCFTQHIEVPLTMPALKDDRLFTNTNPHLPSDRIRHSLTCRRRHKSPTGPPLSPSPPMVS